MTGNMYPMFSIEFKNDVVNRSDVVGWNIETGEAGIWSGLYGNRAYFPSRREANSFLRMLDAQGINTDGMTVVRY